MKININLFKEYIGYFNTYFNNEYILVGGFVDYIEIQTELSKDIDVIITKDKFESVFGKQKYHIKDKNLNISAIKFESIFRTLTADQYSGYYNHNIKTDIFILDMNRINCDHPVADLDKKSMKNSGVCTIDDTKIRFSQVDYRICLLKHLLELSCNSTNLPGWTKDWLNKKQNTLFSKLNLYYQKYPEYKDLLR